VQGSSPEHNITHKQKVQQCICLKNEHFSISSALQIKTSQNTASATDSMVVVETWQADTTAGRCYDSSPPFQRPETMAFVDWRISGKTGKYGYHDIGSEP